MTTADTTIKVPRSLRDRINKRAKHRRITMARAIEEALDEAEELEFWSDVRTYNESLTEEERRAYLRNQTLQDNLADPEDDKLTEEDGW
ncbi:hypothetical protein [Nocardiopsis valliformis]|uniref:hypothetical protein n=1 Tax=Nocardiopsis valliformis TaxID=239974 RepID=UPI0012685127|nr:hypothetical protein [Nocardiopsis valliformis]